jgi:cell division protein FtsB
MPHLSDRSVDRDNATYRKGLVLGLTLAELGILVIFVLLLAFGAALLAKNRQIDQLKRAVPEERAASRVERLLREKAADPAAARSLARELVDSAVRQDAVDEARRRLGQAAAAVTKAEEAAGSGKPADHTGSASAKAPASDRDMDRRGEDLRRRIADIAAERDALKATMADLPSGKSKIAEQMLSTRLENERLKGSMAYATRRLEALGKGSEKPACWATRTGAPEYIFDVTLTSAGIVTHDRALPSRRAEQARLPLAGMAYDRTLQGPGFQSMTKPLFDWGEAHGCRFFVLVTDRTGAAEKRRYKTLLLWVEGHFYKYENRA